MGNLFYFTIIVINIFFFVAVIIEAFYNQWTTLVYIQTYSKLHIRILSNINIICLILILYISSSKRKIVLKSKLIY